MLLLISLSTRRYRAFLILLNFLFGAVNSYPSQSNISYQFLKLHFKLNVSYGK